MKFEWVEYGGSDYWNLVLPGQESPCVWRGEDWNGEHMWHSNTPPIFGSWSTLDEGKKAVVDALRRKYTELLEGLPE